MDAMTFEARPGAVPGNLAVLADGWRLWRRSFWMLGLLALLPVIEELLIQPIPVVGMLASKVIAFLLLGVITVAFDQAATRGRVDLRGIAATLRTNAATWVGIAMICMLGVFGSQVLAGRVLCGPDAWEWLLLGDMKTHPPQQPLALLSVIPFGVAVATLLTFAMPLGLLNGLRPVEAVIESMRIVARHPWFFACYVLLMMLLVTLGALTVVGLVFIAPWSAATSYVVYRLHAGSHARAFPA